jgi:hypothetical protein
VKRRPGLFLPAVELDDALKVLIQLQITQQIAAAIRGVDLPAHALSGNACSNHRYEAG